MKMTLLLLVVTGGAALLSGCATTSTIATSQPSQSVKRVDGRIAIFTIPPKITYERLETEAPLNSVEYGGANIIDVATTTTARLLREKGFRVVDAKGGVEQEAAVKKLANAADRLTASATTTSLLPQLRVLSPEGQHAAVLLQYFRVKVGPNGSWDPILGDMTSMSSCQMWAILIDCQTGQILWHNEVLLREIPTAKSHKFRQSLQLLYQPLQRKTS